jgi:hypothetical protein
MMKKIVLVLFLLIPIVATAGQSGNGNLRTLQSAYGGWIFSIDATANNPETCSKPAFKLDPSIGDSYEQIFSLLLSAYVSNKPVTIFTNGCDTNGYNKLSMIYTSWGI